MFPQTVEQPICIWFACCINFVSKDHAPLQKKKNQPAKNISIPCHRKKYFTTTIFKNKFSEIHFLSTCFVKIWKLKHFLGHEIISNFISTQNKQIHVTNKQTICPQLRGHWSNFDFHQHQQRSPQRAMMGKYSHV